MSSFFLRIGTSLCLSALLSLVSSCNSNVEPTSPTGSLDSSIIVINQGTFGLDDATVSRINKQSNAVDRSWFASSNPGRKLGATANDILFVGDTAFVSVTGSHTIEVMNAKTAVHYSTIQLASTDDPWNLCYVSSGLAAVSTTNGDGVQFFSTTSLNTLAKVHTGPATQGIAATPTTVFVANSGYGTLRDTVPGAGTVSAIDVASKSVTHQVNVGKNVTELALSPDKSKLYAYYQELYTHPSARQGVVEFDVSTMTETRRWELVGMGFINCTASKLYLIGKQDSSSTSWSIMSIDLTAGATTPRVEFTMPSTVSINGFSVNPADGSFWISDARDYTSFGTLIVYNRDGSLRLTYPVGLNPGRVGFYH